MKTKQSIEEKIYNKLSKVSRSKEDFENGRYDENIIKLIKSLSFKEFTELKGKNHSIEIPFSENDLQELQSGEEFNWTFGDIDIHLFKGEEE